jgi:hypothetical protein
MAEQGSKRPHSQARTRGEARAHNPAEAARRELIAWCQAHQLPVPTEHLQSRGR